MLGVLPEVVDAGGPEGGGGNAVGGGDDTQSLVVESRVARIPLQLREGPLVLLAHPSQSLRALGVFQPGVRIWRIAWTHRRNGFGGDGDGGGHENGDHGGKKGTHGKRALGEGLRPYRSDTLPENYSFVTPGPLTPLSRLSGRPHPLQKRASGS